MRKVDEFKERVRLNGGRHDSLGYGSVAEVECVKRRYERKELPSVFGEPGVRELEMLDDRRRRIHAVWHVVEEARLTLTRFQTIEMQTLCGRRETVCKLSISVCAKPCVTLRVK